MPSPRSRVESACRVGAFALLGWLIGSSLVGSAVQRVEHVAVCRANTPACEKELTDRLIRVTRARGEAVHLDAPLAPLPWAADWLAALDRVGVPVTWSGTPPPALLSAQPVAGPGATVRVDVAAPVGTTVTVGDAASEIARVTVADLGATVTAPMVVGSVDANAGGETMSIAPPDSALTRAVLVIGAAGWEGKFIVAALEESAWSVVTRFGVAPGVDVSGGGAAPLDTARFAAVIALDSSVQSLGAILERFVRSGGGLVLVGNAGVGSGMSDLAAGAVGTRTKPPVGPNDTIRLGTTGFYPVLRLQSDAVALDRRRDGVAVAARRVGAGRVLQIGYDDTWRWRMAGGTGAEADHRAWWMRVVESVAYTPAAASAVNVAAAAPLAHLVDRLGPARPSPRSRGGGGDPRLTLIVIAMLLSIEWLSRRLRGVR
ncbi:MAG TPA: hypothetical protein VH277_15795 [Gemmatimonadaceae bacterium]|nr:hypothetical protein [Gemmatimonadaceae bacterium]